MGDHQDGAGEALELLHQPLLGRAVQVVGGLVEDHGFWSLEEDPDQIDPAALTTRETLDVLEQEFLAESESISQPGHGRLGFVAAVLPELLFQVGEEGDVLGRGVLGHLSPGLAQRVIEHVESPARQHVGEAVGLEAEPVELGHLGQVAIGASDCRTAGRAHVAARLLDDHGDEGGLAGAVATDQADLLAGADDERGIAQQGAVADFDGEGGADDHEGGGGSNAGRTGRTPGRQQYVAGKRPGPFSHTSAGDRTAEPGSYPEQLPCLRPSLRAALRTLDLRWCTMARKAN